MNAKITFGGLLYGAIGAILVTTLAVCDIRLFRTNMILGLIVFTLLVAGVVFAVLLGQTLFTKTELISGAVLGYFILIGCVAIRNERNRYGSSAFREGAEQETSTFEETPLKREMSRTMRPPKPHSPSAQGAGGR